MKLLPSAKVELFTTLSLDEVNQVLQNNIGEKRSFRKRFFTDKFAQPFEGKLIDNQFAIQRVIYGRNSFLPQITGTIIKAPNGTKILLSLNIHRFVKMFMYFWLGLVLFLGTIILLVGISQGGRLSMIIPIIMFMVGIGMAHFGFNFEKEKSINELKAILGCED